MRVDRDRDRDREWERERDRGRHRDRDSEQVRSEAGRRTDLWTVQQLLSTATGTGGCCSGS